MDKTLNYLWAYPALSEIYKRRLAETEKVFSKSQARRVRPQSTKTSLRGAFYRSDSWQAIRNFVFERDGRICSKCGSINNLNIDHVLPRSKMPSLELDPLNLRVLCWSCNKSKAARYELDIELKV